MTLELLLVYLPLILLLPLWYGFLHTINPTLHHQFQHFKTTSTNQISRYQSVGTHLWPSSSISTDKMYSMSNCLPVICLQTCTVNPSDGLTPWGGVREGTLRASTFSCSTWRSPPVKQAPSPLEESGRANSINTKITSTQSLFHLCFGLRRDGYMFC